jgi:hypothetical protein
MALPAKRKEATDNSEIWTNRDVHVNEPWHWQSIFRRKYIDSKTLFEVVWKSGDSHFWAGVMAIKNVFFRHGTFSIKNGARIRYRKDI